MPVDLTQIQVDLAKLGADLAAGAAKIADATADLAKVNLDVAALIPPPPPVPVISSVAPNVGDANGGTAVHITGSNFTGTIAVTFNGASASFTIVNDTTLAAGAPAGTVGPCSIVVTNGAGSSIPNTTFTYQVVAPPPPPAPAVISVSPNVGPSTGGIVVTLTGTNFTGATAVTFNGVPATFTVISGASLQATAPAGTVGSCNIVVTTSSGSSAPNNAFAYQTVAPPLPVISAVSPSTGVATGGTVVMLTGTGFAGATGVTFNGVSAQSFSVVGDTSLTAVAPSGTAGPCSVVVTTPSGSSITNTLFTYQAVAPPPPPVPVISSVVPSIGSTAGGTSVMITGQNFTTASVTFGGVPSGFVALLSATSISAVTPPGASGPSPIVVTTAAGSSSPFSGFSYQIPIPTPPPTGPSVDGTIITSTTGGSIRDAFNHIWSLGGPNGPNQLMVDGAPSHDPGGSLPNASVLTILSGHPWYQATSGQWWTITNGNYSQQPSGPVVGPPPPPPPPPNGPPPAPTGTIAFATNASGNHMDSSFPGFSFEKESMCVPAMYNANNTKLIRLMKLLSPNICLRWGANENCIWNASGTGTHYTLGGRSEVAPSNVQQLAGFVKALNAKVIYDVPYWQDAYNPPNEADEIAYVDSLMGDHVLFYQFGNEPDLNGAFNSDYFVSWLNLRSAVLARVPNAKLGGPSLAIPSCGFSRNDGAEAWEGAFADMMGSKLECLTHHYYAWLAGSGGKYPGTQNLALGLPDGFLNNELLAPMQKFVQRNSIPGGFRIEECGSINQGGDDRYSNAFGDAVWVINFCFQCAQYGCKGINHHGGNSNPYAWWDNDFSTGNINWIKPTYYGMLFVSQMLPGKLMDVSSGASSMVLAYGVANDDGGYSAAVINTDTSPVTLTLKFPASAAAASSMLLTDPGGFSGYTYDGGPPSGGTSFGGAKVQLDGTWNPTPTPLTPSGSSVPVTVPAQSAVLVKAR